jgi:hypothetical protein
MANINVTMIAIFGILGIASTARMVPLGFLNR